MLHPPEDVRRAQPVGNQGSLDDADGEALGRDSRSWPGAPWPVTARDLSRMRDGKTLATVAGSKTDREPANPKSAAVLSGATPYCWSSTVDAALVDAVAHLAAAC